MRVYNATGFGIDSALESCAIRLGLRANVRQIASTTYRVRVLPPSAPAPNPYQRVRPMLGDKVRKVAAVCWHGYRDYFREAFQLSEHLRFETALADWRGEADFESRYPASGAVLLGSGWCPIPYMLACTCRDRGRV